jgi:hypothetical protein
LFKTGKLYQNDSKWKSTPLGNQANETIGSWGCLLTSMTMVLNGAGYNETPATLNEQMKAKGGFQGALVLPAVLPMIFPNLVYRGFVACEDSPAPINQIDAALAAGKPVIVQVDWNPQAGIQTHWVVLKEKKGNDYLIYDPFQYKGDTSDTELLLTSRYKHQGADPAHAISGVVWYEVKNSTPPPPLPKVPLPSDPLTIYVSEENLALRAAPYVTGYLLKRMTSGTSLISLEARSAAEAKIGQMGQWLQVQEPGGEQGYTAAWCLAKVKPPTNPAPTPSTNPASTSGSTPPLSSQAGPLKVKATTEGVALRSQPIIADTTLIKRVANGTIFDVLEPGAVSKIGVTGQWLKVKDPQGAEGYVAAWYVVLPGTRVLEPRDATPILLDEKLREISNQYSEVELTKETPQEVLNELLKQFPASGETIG